MLGFDDYPDIAAKVQAVLAGDRPAAPVPQDRRLLLPLAPADACRVPVPGWPARRPAPECRDGGSTPARWRR